MGCTIIFLPILLMQKVEALECFKCSPENVDSPIDVRCDHDNVTKVSCDSGFCVNQTIFIENGTSNWVVWCNEGPPFDGDVFCRDGAGCQEKEYQDYDSGDDKTSTIETCCCTTDLCNYNPPE